MIGVVGLAAGMLLGQPSATLYDLAERMKLVDVAWLNVADRNRRLAAVPHLKAYSLHRSDDLPAAARSLDEALAALLGGKATPADAVTLRLVPPAIEPGKKARLVAGWAYLPGQTAEVTVRAGSEARRLAPGQTAEWEVEVDSPDDDASDAANAKEFGQLLPVAVDSQTRSLYVSVVRNFRQRIGKLLGSNSAISRTLGTALDRQLLQPSSFSRDVPFLQYLGIAEDVAHGRKRIWDLPEIPLVEHRAAQFRIALPQTYVGDPQGKLPLTLVVGLGRNGPDAYFEGNGRGLCVQEALLRNWAFVGLSDRRGMADLMDWLAATRQLRVTQVFLLDHQSLTEDEISEWPKSIPIRAAASFAPLWTANIGDVTAIPLYLAVGAQDDPFELSTARRIGERLRLRAKGRLEEFDPCESTMIVAAAAKSAYRFFDQNRL